MANTTVITHNGSAHFDEVAAIAVILYQEWGKGDIKIIRREPTLLELSDPKVWCVDVGKDYTPSLHNFDHHQDRNIPSSLFLVIEHYSLLEVALEVYPWLSWADEQDRTGPFNTAKAHGVPEAVVPSLANPMVGVILREFAKTNGDTPLDKLSWLWEMLYELGKSIVEGAIEVSKRVELLKEKGAEIHINFTDMMGLYSDISENPQLGLAIYRKKYFPNMAFSITPDNRTPGAWSLFRYDDISKEQIDFTLLEGHPQVAFVHKTGFMAKTVPGLKYLEILRLMLIASKGVPKDHDFSKRDVGGCLVCSSLSFSFLGSGLFQCTVCGTVRY